jgi:hypothetical protein
LLLSGFCSKYPIEKDKPRVLASGPETVFLQFKEQVPLEFKNKITTVQCERKAFRLRPLLAPVSFCWTVTSSEKI